jgi:hypothetical protein
MNRPHLSIAALLQIVLAFGLGLAALRGASSRTILVTSFWTLVTALALLATLLGAVLGAIFLDGRSRAFAVGFGAFGWAFLLLIFPPSGNFLGIETQSGFIADELRVRFNPESAIVYDPLWGKEIGNFRQTFLLELDLLLAFAGGHLALAFARRREGAEEGRTARTPEPRRDP